jgi:hypothetical protein
MTKINHIINHYQVVVFIGDVLKISGGGQTVLQKVRMPVNNYSLQ